MESAYVEIPISNYLFHAAAIDELDAATKELQHFAPEPMLLPSPKREQDSNWLLLNISYISLTQGQGGGTQPDKAYDANYSILFLTLNFRQLKDRV